MGRRSVAGATARQVEPPEHLPADEHHRPLDGEKVDIATTLGPGCCLGAEPAMAAGADDLKAAYGVFKEEARDVTPESAPRTVGTGGWKGTQAAWKSLLPTASTVYHNGNGSVTEGTRAWNPATHASTFQTHRFISDREFVDRHQNDALKSPGASPLKAAVGYKD